ncbi:hypothetical protein D3C85_1887060 [compost metagenome]
METSAEAWIGVTIVELLSLGSGSGVVELTVAVLTSEPIAEALTVPWIRIATEAPLTNEPIW